MPVVDDAPDVSASANEGVCEPWCSFADLPTPCDDYDVDPFLADDAIQVASDVLYGLTGQRWPGECEDTVWPCSQACRSPGRAGCGCVAVDEIELPGRPVVEIVEVMVDGVEVPAEEYRVEDGFRLVGLRRPDGSLRLWPRCQRRDLPDGEEGTWSVTYRFGNAPPVGGLRAAATLACEFVQAWQPEQTGECRLPKRVTTITRQDITLAVLDPLTLFDDGKTGIAEVDLWVASVNYAVKHQAGRFIDPMAAPAFRRVG